MYLIYLVWDSPEAIHQNSANEILIAMVYQTSGSQANISRVCI
jgi:hypothetical protein